MSEVQAQAAEKVINILKFVSGEEVITEVAIEKLEQGGEIVHLVNPYAVIRQFGENNQVNIGIVPLADLSATSSVQVNTAHIVFSAQPNEAFLKHYNDKVNPPLVEVPEKKLIVPGA